MKNLKKAVSAIAASITCSAFAAAPVFQSEILDSTYFPLSLLDDGQVLTYGPIEYGPNTCPIVTRADQTSCNPPVLRQTLSLVAPGSSRTVLPFNVKDARYRFNHAGKGVIWPYDSPSDVQLVDVHTGASTPFAPGIASPFSACGINPGDPGSPTSYWQTLTETGKLIGQKRGGCAPSFAIDLWSSTGTQEMTMPTGYVSMRLADVNKSEQLAITAWDNRRVQSMRALSWTQKSGYKALPVPLLSWLLGYTDSEALAIDDAGNILGNLVKRDNNSHAAIWQAGRTVDIGTLSGYKYSTAIGLSSTGVALLCAYNNASDIDTAGASTLFFWINGTKVAWSSAVVAKDGRTAPSDCAGMFTAALSGPHFWPNGKGQWLIQGSAGTYLVSPTN